MCNFCASVISENFPGLYPGPPLKMEGLDPRGEKEEKGGGRGEGKVKGRIGEGAPTLRCLISNPDRKF
jgi:hypothetical protein